MSTICEKQLYITLWHNVAHQQQFKLHQRRGNWGLIYAIFTCTPYNNTWWRRCPALRVDCVMMTGWLQPDDWFMGWKLKMAQFTPIEAHATYNSIHSPHLIMETDANEACGAYMWMQLYQCIKAILLLWHRCEKLHLLHLSPYVTTRGNAVKTCDW